MVQVWIVLRSGLAWGCRTGGTAPWRASWLFQPTGGHKGLVFPHPWLGSTGQPCGRPSTTLGKHDTNAEGDPLGVSPKINTQRKLSPPCPALRHALPYLSRDIQVERELGDAAAQAEEPLGPCGPQSPPRLPETDGKPGQEAKTSDSKQPGPGSCFVRGHGFRCHRRGGGSGQTEKRTRAQPLGSLNSQQTNQNQNQTKPPKPSSKSSNSQTLSFKNGEKEWAGPSLKRTYRG